MEEGYNAFFYKSQLLEESRDHCALVGLCSMQNPPRRSLKLHKKYEDYISDITGLGWAEDPSQLSWEMIAKGSLLYDYKSSSEIVKIRKNLLLKRAKTFENRKRSKNTEYFELQRFWCSVDKFGWYLPPLFAVEREEFPTWACFKKEPKIRDPFEGVSNSRLYYYLTRLRGARLDVCIPQRSLLSYNDVAACLLYRISGGHHRTLHEVVYALETGYDLDETYKRLKDKLGGYFRFREEPSRCHGLKELFQEAMSSRHENVFPWHERGQSYLTALSPADMSVARYRDMPDGLALFFSRDHPDCNDPALNEAGIYIQVRELQEEFDALRGRGDLYKVPEPVPRRVEESTDEEIQQLRYYQSMMKGALGHLSMAFGEHTVESITLPSVEAYTSIFDASDSEGSEIDIFGNPSYC
jgi:hypothetical protein